MLIFRPAVAPALMCGASPVLPDATSGTEAIASVFGRHFHVYCLLCKEGGRQWGVVWSRLEAKETKTLEGELTCTRSPRW